MEETDYERKRQENILANKALLQQLQLDSNSLEVSKRRANPPKPSSSTRKKPVKKEKQESPAPRRTSSRLAGIPAESESAKRKAEEEFVALESAENAKRQRVAGDLIFDLQAPFVDYSKDYYKTRTFTDEDVKATTDKDLKSIRQKMMGLKIYEKFECNSLKITPERIYHLGFHPTVDKQLIFAGDKVGNLGIFNANSFKEGEDEEEPDISQFKLHSRTISTFEFDRTNATCLYSSSYDGSIRRFDLGSGVASEVFVAEDEDPLSGVEVIDGNVLYFSTLNGVVGRRDLREKNTETWLLSEKKIGGFSLNPRAQHLAATASLDRTVKIWDLRKITGPKDERTAALVAQHTSSKSVSCALWNSHNSLATTSYDDKIKIYKFPDAASWDVGKDLGDIEPDVIIRHNNQSGRWVTILRAQWHQSPEEGPQKLVIANMNRSIDVYSDTGDQLAQLGDDSITAVPAVVQFHPTQNWIAGGTASGKLALFM